MKDLLKNRTTVCNFICALFMLILLVLQFTPYWNSGTETSSIQSYVWFPSDHAELDTYMQTNVSSDFKIDSIIGMPILVLVLGVAGLVLCIWKNSNILVTLLPIACGLVGVWGYLSKAAFQLGSNWVLHLIVCIAMIAVGLFAFVKEIMSQKNEE